MENSKRVSWGTSDPRRGLPCGEASYGGKVIQVDRASKYCCLWTYNFQLMIANSFPVYNPQLTKSLNYKNLHNQDITTTSKVNLRLFTPVALETWHTCTCRDHLISNLFDLTTHTLYTIKPIHKQTWVTRQKHCFAALRLYLNFFPKMTHP